MLPMPKKIVALTLMLGLLVFTGCQTVEEMPSQTMELAEPVSILHSVVGGHPSLKSPMLLLVTSQAQLDALSADDLVGREVDFYSESVVLSALGEMPSTGYWVHITSVHQEGGYLYIQGQANRPPKDAMTGQVLTFPYCAVVIPRTTATALRDQIESVEDHEPPM